jgi:hypothetical protein
MEIHQKGEEEKRILREQLTSWGNQAILESNWLREQSSKLGLDEGKLVLGHVIRIIIGDDENSFNYMHTFIKDEDFIEGNKINALKRLTWEIETPEVPAYLRETLIKVKEEFIKSDWTNEESFYKSKEEWSKMRDEVRELSETNKLIKDAFNYYESNYQKIPIVTKPKIQN